MKLDQVTMKEGVQMEAYYIFGKERVEETKWRNRVIPSNKAKKYLWDYTDTIMMVWRNSVVWKKISLIQHYVPTEVAEIE